MNKDKTKKQIAATYAKIYYIANQEKLTVYAKKYYKANQKKIAVRAKKYYTNNKKQILAHVKEYCINNKNKKAACDKKYQKANQEKIAVYKKQYRKANKDKINTCQRQKRKTDVKYKLNHMISNGMRKSLKNGKDGIHWLDLVPYTLNDLIKRLKKTLPAGYTWDDYINGKTDLHIDHEIPISVFNFKSYIDINFQRCWALKNLQLLPAKKNISKGAKLTKHFQLSLFL